VQTAIVTIHTRHFDREKALEVILHIASRLRAPTLHSISKTLYLADKQHLQEFGRLICGDQYIAMGYGPVPSAIYDMMKVPDGRRSIDVDWDVLIKEAFEITQGRNVRPLRDANTDLLSESEVQCIEKIVATFGNKSFGQLTDMTHDDAWKRTSENQTIPLEAIAATLPNAGEIIDYLRSH